MGALAGLTGAAAGDAVAFEVVGTPVPQGSGRVLGGVMVTKTPALSAYRADIANGAAKAMAEGHLAMMARGPVAVLASFRFPMPTGRLVSERQAGRIPKWTRPDVDKLARALLDGLVQGGVIHDDAQVACLMVGKDELAEGWQGTEVVVWPLPRLGRGAP